MTAVYEWIRNLTAFFLFLSVMENLLPGQKYGKYIRLFAGMVLILLAVEPFTSGFDLEEVLARSYEDLMVRGEAEELKEQLGVSEQKRLGQIFSQYEEAVGRDVRELAQSLGVSLSDCSVRIEDDESSPEFGTVREIRAVLSAQSAPAEQEKLSNKIQEYYGLEEQYVEIKIAGGEGPVGLSSDGGRDPLYPGVSGVGEVDVMIVLKSSAEKVIQVDNSTSKSVTTEKGSGTDRSVESMDQEHSTVLTGSGSGQEPVVAKEVYPEIAGIVISASGGGQPSVQAEISEAMEALFGLPANKIKVLKRVE